jgi:spore maturation protein CgeB
MGGGARMKFAFFYHAITSCWNNGHAHFLRGVTRALAKFGHSVTVCEEEDGWSRRNAVADGGSEMLQKLDQAFPFVRIARASPPRLDEVLAGADVVVVHEWNEPALISALGRRRLLGGPFQLLFHDTHHRAVTAPEQLADFELEGYDGVLAFGEALREIYLRRGWADRAYVWHEAADTTMFYPRPHLEKTCDVVWIGNWGDDERSDELKRFLIDPVARLQATANVYGVRYPADALQTLAEANIAYHGWLPNHRVGDVFATARTTVHVPRGPYAGALPGIPTIRMFEALACGIPLVSAPWSDCEHLFPADCYLRAATSGQMEAALSKLLGDREFAEALAASGLEAIKARHTCDHRANELLAIVAALQAGQDSELPRRIAS